MPETRAGARSAVAMAEAESDGRISDPMPGAIGRLRRGLGGLSPWGRAVAAFAFGALGVLALAPVHAVPVLFVSLPGLLWCLAGARTGRGAFATGWAFGFGFHLFGLYWISFALTVDLAAFFWLMPFAAAGLPALLAVFPGLVAVALRRLPVAGVARVAAFAALWGVAEWLRGHLATGFPWNLYAYAWVGWPPIAQLAAWIGAYGLTVATVFVAALPAAAWRADGRVARRGAVAAAAGVLALVVAGSAGTTRLAGAADGPAPDAPRLRLVQPNIPQSQKWNRDRAAENFALHLALSQEGSAAARDRLSATIWPETAVPYFLEREPRARDALGDVAPPGGLLITGVPRAGPPEAPPRYWNSLRALDSGGEIVATYDKAHLVPFGEYVPLRDLLPIDKVTAGSVDYSAGPGPRTVSLPGLPPASPLICYEVIFPGAVVDRDGPRPAWLLNVTNDAWYGETAGPHQHFAIARMRAIEEGLPLVRVATTGISGVVDAQGRTVARLGLGERGALDAPLPPPTAGPPLYARIGDAGFWALCALLAVGAAGAGLRRRSG
ncbi:MAG: apolipoprotein N-acyltransferase [Azospirillaceae bacterium]